MAKDEKTIHVTFDIPARQYGDFIHEVPQRFTLLNPTHQANIVRPKKGDTPGRAHGLTMSEVILKTISSSKNPRVSMEEIRGAVEAAGFSPTSASTYVGELVDAKAIVRVDRGVYSIQKALPAPKKTANKKASS